MSSEVEVLAAAAGELVIESRRDRWVHLSLCVLDAVFSINARYGGVVRVCHRYADRAELPDRLRAAADVGQVVGTDQEQALETLARLGRQLGPDQLAREVLRNRGRTSTRGGILKADAAVQYAEILVDAGVQRIGDVTALLADPDRLAQTERSLSAVPGHGAGARLSYLWMLTGDDHHVKPDRMVLRWVSGHLDRDVSVRQAGTLLPQVAEHLGCTPWELDHAIWRRQSGRS